MKRSVIARVAAVFLGAGLWGVSVSAEPVEDLIGCRAIKDDTVRLACFDALADTLLTAPVVPETSETGEPQIVEVPETSASPVSPTPPSVMQAANEVETAAPAASVTTVVPPNPVEATDEPAPPVIEQNTPEEPTEFRSKIAELKITGLNKAIVTLENGQIWRQLNSDSTSVRKRTPIGTGVTIKKAAFGSHRMIIDGGRSFKVKRVR